MSNTCALRYCSVCKHKEKHKHLLTIQSCVDFNEKFEKLIVHCALVGTCQQVVVFINKITLEIEQ